MHVVGRLSGLTQVLDAKVSEGEKALDALDVVVWTMSSRMLVLLRFSTERISLLNFREVRRGDDGGHRRHECRRHRLRMKPRLEDIEMVHVEEQCLLASVRSELVRACDVQAHSLRVHIQVGQAPW